MNIPEHSAGSESMEDARRTYYMLFSMKYGDAFRPHAAEGQTFGGKKHPDIWRNVGEHCLVAGSFAELIAQEMGLTPEQVERVTVAALLHDWYKKHETIARRRAATVDDVRHIIDEVKAEDQTKLEQYGFPADVIALTGVNIPESTDGPRTDEERIMWYVDAMLQDTQPMPIDERLHMTAYHPDEKRSQANRDFSDSYRAVYNGKSLFDVQSEVGRIVGAYIAERIGFDGDPATLPLHLKELMTQRIASL